MRSALLAVLLVCATIAAPQAQSADDELLKAFLSLTFMSDRFDYEVVRGTYPPSLEGGLFPSGSVALGGATVLVPGEGSTVLGLARTDAAPDDLRAGYTQTVLPSGWTVEGKTYEWQQDVRLCGDGRSAQVMATGRPDGGSYLALSMSPNSCAPTAVEPAVVVAPAGSAPPMATTKT